MIILFLKPPIFIVSANGKTMWSSQCCWLPPGYGESPLLVGEWSINGPSTIVVLQYSKSLECKPPISSLTSQSWWLNPICFAAFGKSWQVCWSHPGCFLVESGFSVAYRRKSGTVNSDFPWGETPCEIPTISPRNPDTFTQVRNVADLCAAPGGWSQVTGRGHGMV